MITSTLLALLALGASSQVQSAQPQWLAFEGCWRQVASEITAAPSPLLCIQQSGEGALLSTYVNGKLQSEQRLTADGSARPVDEGGCKGAELARWSGDGQRVYIRAELTCGNAPRLVSSALALVNAESMVEVQALRVGENASLRTVRYRAMPAAEYPAGFALAAGEELARETARLHAASALAISDVIEGAQQLDAAALEGLLATRSAGFDLDAKVLRQLATAGVARSTIDVMVALSYPDEFRVAEQVPAPTRLGNVQPVTPAYVGGWDRYNAYDCYGLGYYSSYACDYRYGYNRYGYANPYGYYNPYGWNNGGVIVVRPNDGNGDGGSDDGGGTVGRSGYSRGSGSGSLGTARPRSEPTGSSMPRHAVQPAGGSSGSRGGSVSGGSAGSTGSGGVSGAGHSAGSGSQSTGQTAKPRGGGH